MPKRNSVLIDTNILIASAYAKDVHYRDAVLFFEVYGDRDLVVPAPVLTELFHVVLERESYRSAFRAVMQNVEMFEIVSLERIDYFRAFDIMRGYRDAELDFTDASIMALAERYAITEIATFDRRDFSLVTPSHAEHFTLLP